MTRQIETHRLDWNGITIEIIWEANWLNLTCVPDMGHLDIASITPPRASLPITETGYRSHFTAPETVAAIGGPVGFVEAWLESESQRPEWSRYAEERRQYMLF